MAIKLGTMMVQAGLISLDQLDEALKYQVIFGGKLGTNLIEMGLADEEDIARVLSDKLQVPSISSEQLLDVRRDVIALISKEIAAKYRVVPVALERKRLSLAIQDPSDLPAVDEIAFATGYAIKPLVAPEVSLVLALEKHYGINRDLRYISVIRQLEKKNKTRGPSLQAKSSAPIETTSGDPEAWRESVSHFSIDAISSSLAEVRERDEIASLVLDYAALEFAHAALFLVRKGSICGWQAFAEGRQCDDFPHFSLSLDEPSVLRTVVETRSFYMGQPAPDAANAQMFDALGERPGSTVLLVPIIKHERTICILYVSGPATILSGHFFDLQKLLQKASLAFDMLILRNKILMT